MDALTRCTTLAALLWPDAVDVTLRIDPSARLAHRVSAFIVPAGESLNLHRAAAGACADAPAALDALSDFLAHLARRRAAEFLCAAGDTVVAPSPVPSRDELADRLADRERAPLATAEGALASMMGRAVEMLGAGVEALADGRVAPHERARLRPMLAGLGAGIRRTLKAWDACDAAEAAQTAVVPMKRRGAA